MHSTCLLKALLAKHCIAWVDDGSPVDVVYLDFQKAFDKVPHQRLLLKLKAHGIGNDVINWKVAYTQKTESNNRW